MPSRNQEGTPPDSEPTGVLMWGFQPPAVWSLWDCPSDTPQSVESATAARGVACEGQVTLTPPCGAVGCARLSRTTWPWAAPTPANAAALPP